MVNKTFKLGLLIFMFLIVLNSVFAVKPEAQTSDANNSLDIIYPKDNYFLFNNNFSFHVHAVNSSGSPLMANQFHCEAHFYDTDNSHILEIVSVDDSNGWDDSFKINTSLTSVLGTKPYNIFCNSTQGETGFVSDSFMVTYDSEGFEFNYIAFIGVFALFFFAWLLLKMTFSLDDEHMLIKLFLLIISFVVSVLAVQNALTIIQTSLLSTRIVNNAVISYKWVLRVLWVFIAYIMGYYIFKVLKWHEKLVKYVERRKN